MSFEYFNGQSTIQANNIDKLLDLNETEIGNLATGPQDLFFEKLDCLNRELEHNNIEKVDVTPIWNWRPGSYDKVKAYMYKKLYLHKKTTNMDNLFYRTKDRINYMGYIQRQVRDMEIERANLKRLGILRNPDIDKWTIKTKEFSDSIINSCEKVFESTEEKVLIVPYISNIDDRNPRLYYDITLKNLTMGIYSGNNLIQELPLEDINIIISESLRHKLSNMRGGQVQLLGDYKTDSYRLRFPYISDRGRYSNRDSNYRTVCLDKYTDDFYKFFNKNDLLSASFILMQWAQYYNTNYANPYNQPYFLHLGAPKHLTDEYIATQSKSAIIDNVQDIIRWKIQASSYLNIIEKNQLIVDEFEKLDCRWKEEYHMYQDALNALAVVNTEQWFIYEAIILEIISKAKSLFISMQENSSNEPLVSLNSEIAAINRTGFDYWSCVDSNENASSIDVQDIVWERVEEEILRSLILYYHNLIKDNSKFCPHTQIWLINNGFQDKV